MFWMYWTPFLKDAGHSPAQGRTARKRGEYAPPSAAETLLLQHPLLDTFNDQVACVVDHKHNCLTVSENWQERTGHDARALVGKSLLEMAHPDHREKFANQLSAGRLAKVKERCRIQFRHADDSWHWYEISLLFDKSQGRDAPRLCMMRDISDHVSTLKTLQKAKLDAELALKGRSEFLANMSHDLRTPLNAILGFSQIMQQQIFGKITNKKYVDYLSNIQDSGQELLARINDLFELASMDAGATTLEEESISLAQLIRIALESHRQYAFAHQITLKEALPKQPIALKVDRLKMKRVLGNLLANALAASPAGSKVTIGAQLLAGDTLAIRIQDEGKGLSPEQMKNIHLALAQENSIYARDMNGIGIGLALVKEYVTLHHGEVEIESRPNGGCRVTVFLPSSRVNVIETEEASLKRASA